MNENQQRRSMSLGSVWMSRRLFYVPCLASLLLFVASSGCGGKDQCEHGKARALNEACCVELGNDACDSGLFCAAFDGSDEPICHEEHSRLGLEECTSDRHCASRVCNHDEQRCQSSPETACEPEVGCSWAEGRHVCANETCVPSHGLEGDPCGVVDDCEDTLFCARSTCSNGEVGDPCGEASECVDDLYCCRHEDLCGGGSCSEGAAGDHCADASECQDGLFCGRGTCSEGLAGDRCDDPAECQEDLLCVNTRCAVAAVDPYDRCGPEIGYCVEGLCLSQGAVLVPFCSEMCSTADECPEAPDGYSATCFYMFCVIVCDANQECPDGMTCEEDLDYGYVCVWPED